MSIRFLRLCTTLLFSGCVLQLVAATAAAQPEAAQAEGVPAPSAPTTNDAVAAPSERAASERAASERAAVATADAAADAKPTAKQPTAPVQSSSEPRQGASESEHSPHRRMALQAQPEAPECDEYDGDDAEGQGTFLIGMSVFDLSALNERLTRAGYARLDSVMTVIGGEGRAIMKSGFVVGGRGAALIASDAEGPGELRAQLGGGFGMVDFGFAFVRSRQLLLTLTAGLGGYGLGLDLGEQQALDFDDVLENPRQGSSLGSGGLLTGLMLSFDGRGAAGKPERGTRRVCEVAARQHRHAVHASLRARRLWLALGRRASAQDWSVGCYGAGRDMASIRVLGHGPPLRRIGALDPGAVGGSNQTQGLSLLNFVDDEDPPSVE